MDENVIVTVPIQLDCEVYEHLLAHANVAGVDVHTFVECLIDNHSRDLVKTMLGDNRW